MKRRHLSSGRLRGIKGKGKEGQGLKWATQFLKGLPGLLNIPAILCIWKWVSLLKWRGGKGRDERVLTVLGVFMGDGLIFFSFFFGGGS